MAELSNGGVRTGLWWTELLILPTADMMGTVSLSCKNAKDFAAATFRSISAASWKESGILKLPEVSGCVL